MLYIKNCFRKSKQIFKRFFILKYRIPEVFILVSFIYFIVDSAMNPVMVNM